MGLTERSFLERMELMGLTESKEYVKIEIGTFYRFVNFLSLLVDWSVHGEDENICLQSMIRDFENEVIHGVDGEA